MAKNYKALFVNALAAGAFLTGGGNAGAQPNTAPGAGGAAPSVATATADAKLTQCVLSAVTVNAPPGHPIGSGMVDGRMQVSAGGMVTPTGMAGQHLIVDIAQKHIQIMAVDHGAADVDTGPVSPTATIVIPNKADLSKATLSVAGADTGNNMQALARKTLKNLRDCATP